MLHLKKQKKNSYLQLHSHKVLANGSLLVGSSFAKSLALALNIPFVNHMQAHVLAHFMKEGLKNQAFHFSINYKWRPYPNYKGKNYLPYDWRND
jgi:hypothetical protein